MIKYFVFLFSVFYCANLVQAGGFAVAVDTMVSTSATSTSTKVIDKDPYRNYLIIQNNGAANIIVKFGSAQTASEGIIIPAGGNYEPFKGITDSVYAVSSTGSQAIVILSGH